MLTLFLGCRARWLLASFLRAWSLRLPRPVLGRGSLRLVALLLSRRPLRLISTLLRRAGRRLLARTVLRTRPLLELAPFLPGRALPAAWPITPLAGRSIGTATLGVGWRRHLRQQERAALLCRDQRRLRQRECGNQCRGQQKLFGRHRKSPAHPCPR